MGTTTVRISSEAQESLRALSEQTGKPMRTVAEEAIDLYRRRRFLEDVNTAYAALREDPQAWAEIEEERDVWEATLADGLPGASE